LAGRFDQYLFGGGSWSGRWIGKGAERQGGRSEDESSYMSRGGGVYDHFQRNGDGGLGHTYCGSVVTGVGFLGAGAIIQDRGGIHGLTTAATIWLVASIGMACGAQFYLLAIVCAVITIIVLFGLGKLSDRLDRHVQKHNRSQVADDTD
jgi:hypothetical protein